MTDFSDLRRRAALHSKSGNYWAGKCLALLDLLDAAPEPEQTDRYRIAVRPRGENEDWCDDVVVNDVSMFRMEQMNRRVWWACCYLNGEDDGNRISFDIRYVAKERDVVVTVTEWPAGVAYENDPSPHVRQEAP